MDRSRERSALEVLRQVEWVQDEYGGWCPICDMEEDWDHAPGCALDAVLRATPADDSYWWCPECHEEVDSSRVTWQEIHDHCGTRVESRVTPASDGGEVRERVIRDLEGAARLLEYDCGDPSHNQADVLLEAAALLRTPSGEGEGWRPWVGPGPDARRVLAYREDAGVFVAEYAMDRNGRERWWTDGGGEELTRGQTPTHWIPLPDGPYALRSGSGTPQGEGKVRVAAAAYLDALDRYRQECRTRDIPLAEYDYHEWRRLAEPVTVAERRLHEALRSAPTGVEEGEEGWPFTEAETEELLADLQGASDHYASKGRPRTFQVDPSGRERLLERSDLLRGLITWVREVRPKKLTLQEVGMGDPDAMEKAEETFPNLEDQVYFMYGFSDAREGEGLDPEVAHLKAYMEGWKYGESRR